MQEFDKLVKNIMENGAEEVPAGLWDAVQSQIPAPVVSKKPVVLVWARRAGVALAAAAAIALGVFFANRQPATSEIEILQNDGTALADIVDEEIPEITPAEENFVPTSVTDKRISRYNATATSSEKKAETAVEVATEQVAEAVTEQNAVAVQEIITAEKLEKAEQSKTDISQHNYTNPEDPFALMEGEDRLASRKKMRAELTFFGNASSNTNPNSKGARGPMKVAAATPSATGITETGESTFMIPLSFGAGMKFNLTERWSLGVGLDCSYLTRTYAGTYREFDNNGTILRTESYSDIRNNQVYIGIPVNAYFSIVKNNFIDFYAYGGGSLEQCVTNRHTMTATDGNTHYKGALGNPTFSAGLGLGCEFIVADHLGIYIDPSARYYFKNSTTPKSVRTQQPFMAGIEIGLRVRL